MRILAVISGAFFLFAVADAGDDPAGAYTPMAVFDELAGRAFRGEGTGPDGQPIVDISRFEWILGGRALQSTHKLDGATYGGRTIFFYDEGAEAYVFHYFTTAGFHTVGTVTPTENGFTAVETVRGLAEVAEVRSTWVIDDGHIIVTTTQFSPDGAASPGDEFVYAEIDDPGALYESSTE